MNTVFILILSGAACGLFKSVRKYFKTRNAEHKWQRVSLFDGVWSVYMHGLGGLGCAFLLGISLQSAVPVKFVESQPLYLTDLKVSQDLEGTFFLGIGNVKTSTVYHFHYRNGDGSLTEDYLHSSDIVRIVEDPALKDEALIITTVVEPDYSVPVTNWFPFPGLARGTVKREIHVPAGSVDHSIRVK